jgi:hypothetical protein
MQKHEGNTYGNTIQQHTGKSYIEAKEQNRLTFQFQSIFFSTFTKNLNALQSDIDPQNLQEMDPEPRYKIFQYAVVLCYRKCFPRVSACSN